MEKEIQKEVREVIIEKQEFKLEKKLTIDKKSKQISIRIPKEIESKQILNLSKDSIFEIIFNLEEEETKKMISKSKLIIYLKEGK